MKNAWKKLIVVCLILPLVFVAVANSNSDDEQIREKRTVEPFTSIIMNGVCDVYLSQGDKELVTVEAVASKMGTVITNVCDGILVIDFKNTKSSLGLFINDRASKINIYIVVKDLNSLSQNGVGDLKCVTDIKLSSINITNNGVGDIELRGSADNLKIYNSGVGDVEAAGFVAKKVYLNNSGVGDVQVMATDDIEVYNSGVGGVKYYGAPKVRNIHSSGIGSVKGK